jgi:conjugative transfer region protein TrbK
MMPHLTPRQFARIAAVSFVVLIVALTIVQSRHSEQPDVLAPLEHGDAAALVQELAHCRTITSDETAALEACRRTWAENRRQFFGSATSPQSPADPVLKAPAAPAKNQDRILPREVEPQQGEAR